MKIATTIWGNNSDSKKKRTLLMHKNILFSKKCLLIKKSINDKQSNE